MQPESMMTRRRSRWSKAAGACIATMVGFAVATGRAVVVHIPARTNTPAIVQEAKTPAVDLANGTIVVTRQPQQGDQPNND